MGPYCSVCGGGCPPSGCNKSRFQWGFGGDNRCFLMGRLDGVDVKPLDLCSWLYCHETDTNMRLVPNGKDSYVQYNSERDINGCNGDTAEPDRIYICDMLNLGSLSCLGDVTEDEPQSCDILVFDPCCDDESCEACIGSDNVKKWKPYHIPDAGDCVMEADENGYFKVLTKSDCGCITECKFKDTGETIQYVLRDSYPDDPDWPFRYGNYSENIPLLLSNHAAKFFGKSDLEVRIEYAFGVARPTSSPDVNVRSLVVPTQTGGVSDVMTQAIVLQGTTALPWAVWESQASKTILVPKGREVHLAHTVQVRSNSSYPNMFVTAHDGGSYNGVSPAGPALANFNRLHALVITVRPTRAEYKGDVS